MAQVSTLAKVVSACQHTHGRAVSTPRAASLTILAARVVASRQSSVRAKIVVTDVARHVLGGTLKYEQIQKLLADHGLGLADLKVRCAAWVCRTRRRTPRDAATARHRHSVHATRHCCHTPHLLQHSVPSAGRGRDLRHTTAWQVLMLHNLPARRTSLPIQPPPARPVVADAAALDTARMACGVA